MLPMLCFCATSSITSADKCLYTVPISTNAISGKVMGKTISYLVPRVEDRIFLSEAEVELWHTYAAFTYSSTYTNDLPVTNYESHVIKRDGIFWYGYGTEYKINEIFNDQDYQFGFIDRDSELTESSGTFSSAEAGRNNVAKKLFQQEKYDYYSITNYLTKITNRVLKVSVLTNAYCILDEMQSKKFGAYNRDDTYSWFGDGTTYTRIWSSDTPAWTSVSMDNDGVWNTYPIEASHYESTNTSVICEFDNLVQIEKTASTGVCIDYTYDSESGDYKREDKSSEYGSVIEWKNVQQYNHNSDTNIWYNDLVVRINHAGMEWGGFNHIKSYKVVAVCKISDSLEKTFHVMRNQEDVYTHEDTSTNFYAFAKINCEMKKVDGDYAYHFIFPYKTSKEMLKAIYPSGQYDDTIAVPNPSFPSVSDCVQDVKPYDSHGTFSNGNRFNSHFNIRLVGFALFLEFQYNATFE